MTVSGGWVGGWVGGVEEARFGGYDRLLSALVTFIYKRSQSHIWGPSTKFGYTTC